MLKSIYMAKKKKPDYLTTSFNINQPNRRQKISPEEFKRQQTLLNALGKTSQYLAAETNLELILSRIAATLGKALNAKYVNFWDFTLDKKAVFIIAAYGMQKAYLAHSKKVPLKLGTAWVGRCMQTGETWSTSDCPKDPILPPKWLPVVKKQNYHGLLCMPLMKKGEIIGGMCIYYPDVHHFDELEMNIATIAANQAATAVANSRLFTELTAERNKTLAIVYSLKDGLIMYDLEGRIVFFNPKAEELLWLSGKDVVNKQVDENAKKQSIYWSNLFAISNIAQSDYSTREFTTEGPQKVFLEVTLIPVRDQNNQKIGSVRVLRDITKEKELELMKSSFVSIASHQLRTPLSAIKWSLSLLSTGGLGPLSDKQNELVRKTFSANQRLINLVDDLLNVSRIEEGRLGYTFAQKNLAELTEKIYGELKPDAERHGLKFEFKKPAEELPLVSLDDKKLDIAIRNTIDNAVKYTPANGRVEISFEKGQKYLFLLIKDNGIGIPEKEKKFIFNKFYRAGNAIRFQTEGSGLGLYIAKSISEKHNAMLSFDSEENKGSTFTFQFPLDPQKMPKQIAENF